MSITTSTKAQEPVVDPDAHLLAKVQDVLGVGGSINDQALAVAKLGHPTWFARRCERGGYNLLQPANRGTVVEESFMRLFTTSETKLQQQHPQANALAFRVTGADGRTVTYGWAAELNRVEPYRVVERPLGDQLSVRAPAARPAPKPYVQPVVVIDRELAADQIRKYEAQIEGIKSQIGDLGDQAYKIGRQASLDESEIERLSDARSSRAADALREGADIGDRHPETGAITKLRLRIEAAEKALRANARDREALEKKLALVREQRVASIVEWAGAEHTGAVADLRGALQDLLPHLVRVSAIDRAKQALVGTAKLVSRAPNHPGLVSGEKLVATLVAALPDPIRPDELKPAALSAVTAKAAAELLNAIREG